MQTVILKKLEDY